TALMRQLEALKNINQYGEQAGTLINQLTDANNRYDDEVKKINSETHRSEADKRKALKAAADLRDEEIKRIRIATDAALTMADADREMALESDDHKRRRLEIMKLAQTEIQKITDDEAKATALLDSQLKNKTITQDQYETQRTALSKKYADARFGIEAKMQADLMTLEELRIAEEAKNEQDRLNALAEQKRKEMELQRNLQEAELEAARKWDDELTGREEDDGYDLEALRRRWELEFNIKSDLERKLFQIEVEYLDELAKLEAAYANDSEEYKRGLKFLDDIKAKKIKEAKEPVREEYDLEALRRRWETEFNIKSELKRALFQIEVEYIDEAAKLERAYAKDTAEYKAGLKKLEEIKEKKIEDARRTASMELIDTISGYYSSAMTMVSKDVVGGLQGLMSQVANQTQTAWLGWASFGVGVIKDFFDLFGSKSESALDRMKKQLQSIMDEMDRVSDKTGIGLAEKIFGADSSKYSEEALKSANDAVKVWREANPLLAWMDDEQIYEFRKKLKNADFTKINWGDYTATSQNWETIGPGRMGWKEKNLNIFDTKHIDPRTLTANDVTALVGQIRELFENMYGEYADEMLASFGLTGTDQQIWGKWVGGVKNRLTEVNNMLIESAGKAAEALQLLDDAKVRDALATYKEQLADIDHKLKTGKLTDEEAIKAQLEVYDQMLLQIESLDESTEKEAARNKLLEERYALEQNLLALQDKEKNGLSEILATEEGRA
ncbi:MAG TPA: hypothetical protein PKO06_16715, partial [Candidatus Ozemobacteraceae bacterium]|nr:hypothetical protein [Candidatus Ozemobacteraceae bacterium]